MEIIFYYIKEIFYAFSYYKNHDDEQIYNFIIYFRYLKLSKYILNF